MNNSRLNHIYNDMKKRCYKPYCKAYKWYGARGITICDEWLDPKRVVVSYRNNCTKGYLAFKNWALENGYADNLTLDRIDNNKGYFPENCRWVSMKVQTNNNRHNHLVTYKNKTQSIALWCDELGLYYPTVKRKFAEGCWSVEDIFENPRNKTWGDSVETIISDKTK